MEMIVVELIVMDRREYQRLLEAVRWWLPSVKRVRGRQMLGGESRRVFLRKKNGGEIVDPVEYD